MSANRFKSIMVVVNDPFAKRQPALAKAAAIAQRCGSQLLVFNSFMLPQPVADAPMGSHQEIIASATRQRRERLRALVATLRLAGTTCVVRWDYPAHEAIVREVLLAKPDLLVTDSHRRGRLARLLLSNTDWELIRACPCPLWFVRSPALPKRLQVLVAVDPGHSKAKPARLDDRLLQVSRDLIDRLTGRIAIVHARETSARPRPELETGSGRRSRSREAHEFITDSDRAVNSLGARHGVDLADCIMEEGAIRDVIAAAARRRKADLLVMGAVSRSFPTRPVIGSTAETVIDHVDCDLLVVKPAGFKSPVKRTHKAIAEVSKPRANRKLEHVGA